MEVPPSGKKIFTGIRPITGYWPAAVAPSAVLFGALQSRSKVAILHDSNAKRRVSCFVWVVNPKSVKKGAACLPHANFLVNLLLTVCVHRVLVAGLVAKQQELLVAGGQTPSNYLCLVRKKANAAFCLSVPAAAAARQQQPAAQAPQPP